MLYIYFDYSSLHRLRQAILVSYMVNGGLIESLRKDTLTKGPVQRRERLGGMLSYYYREAA